MEIENTLAKNITAAGEKAAYDAACKRLLANKIILALIMKISIEEYKTHSIHAIAEKYLAGVPQIAEETAKPSEETRNRGEQIQGVKNEDSTIQEGTITYDIRFLAIVPGTGETIRLMVNVEAQNDFYPGYPIIKRALYYCSRMISSQYGSEFTETQYEN